MKSSTLAAVFLLTGFIAPLAAAAQEPQGEVKVQAYGIEAGAYQVTWSYPGPTDSVRVRAEFTRDADGTTHTFDVATVLPTAPFVNLDDIAVPLRKIVTRPDDCFHLRFLVTIILNSTEGPTGAHEFTRPICLPITGLTLPLSGQGPPASLAAPQRDIASRITALDRVLLTATLGAMLLVAGLRLRRTIQP